MTRVEYHGQFQPDINLVAQYRALGMSAADLRRAHHPDIADQLSHATGVLIDRNLMAEADRRAEEIRREKKAQTQNLPDNSSIKPLQQDFFSLIHDDRRPSSPQVSDDGGRLEKTIDRWHQAFNGRGLGYDRKREKLLQPDVSHDWRQFLKEIGYTQKNRTERMRKKTEDAIQRLYDAGVMQMLYNKMTPAEQQNMIKILEEFDQDHRQPWRAWESSDGITIYPSEISMKKDRG